MCLKVDEVNAYMTKARKIVRTYIKLAEEAASEAHRIILFIMLYLFGLRVLRFICCCFF